MWLVARTIQKLQAGAPKRENGTRLVDNLPAMFALFYAIDARHKKRVTNAREIKLHGVTLSNSQAQTHWLASQEPG